jgi:hypothetical protein
VRTSLKTRFSKIGPEPDVLFQCFRTCSWSCNSDIFNDLTNFRFRKIPYRGSGTKHCPGSWRFKGYQRA